MRTSHKVLTAAAVAGVALAGGAAFTGTGLGTTAPTSQFIGGTVSQSVTGATLAGVTYGFADSGSNTQVNSINLTFSGTADGRAVSVSPSGGSGGTFSCGAVLNNASACTFTPATTEAGYTGLTSLAITVAE